MCKKYEEDTYFDDGNTYVIKDNKLELYFVHNGVLKQVCLAENANRYVLALTADKEINKELTTIYVNSQLEDIDSFIDDVSLLIERKKALKLPR